MLWNYLTLLKEIRWADLLDIGLAAVLLWFVIHALRAMHTRGAGTGLLLYGTVVLAANQLGLGLSLWLLQGLTAVVVLIIVVVYQGEFRRLLERFPATLTFWRKVRPAGTASLTDLLANALENLAAARHGAPIVLAGDDPLDSLVTSGVPLDGQISKTLLLSIFDPNSPGHDGALVIRNNRVERFGCRLPLSDHEEQLRDRGTRHAAALGLAERTDVLVLIVSEETGRASLAKDGRLSTPADPSALREEIAAFIEQHADPQDAPARGWALPAWLGFEAVVGLLIAAVLWLVLVPASVIETATYQVPVEVQNIPEDFVLESVDPPHVAVTLSGRKRDLFRLGTAELAIRLDGTLTRFGRRTYPINDSNLTLPPGIEVSALVPNQVRISGRTRN